MPITHHEHIRDALVTRTDPTTATTTTNLVSVDVQRRGSSAVLVFDEFTHDPDRRDTEVHPDAHYNTHVKRHAILDVHDARKLARFYPDGQIPKLSRPDTLDALIQMELLRPSVDASHDDNHAGLNPSLGALFLFARSYASMNQRQYGSKTPRHQAMIVPSFFVRYRDVLCEGSLESKRFLARMLDADLADLLTANGMLTTKGFPSIELQHEMAHAIHHEMLTSRRSVNAYASKPPSKSDMAFAEVNFIESLVVRWPREFWTDNTSDFEAMTDYTHRGEGLHISELGDEVFTEVERLSRLGLIYLKDGEFVYRTSLLDAVLSVACSHSVDLAYG